MEFCSRNGGHISGNEIVKPFGTKGALLYGVIPVCVLCETERPGQMSDQGVLCYFVPNKGQHPLRRFAGMLLIRQKA